MHLIELAALYDIYGGTMTPEEQREFRRQEFAKGVLGVMALCVVMGVLLAFSYAYGV